MTAQGEPNTPELRSPSPTVRRRELGALLRSLRGEAGLTVEQVAESLLCSPSKVSRLETGHRGASQRDIRDLCGLYHVTDPVQRDHLASLAKQGRGQAWWQPYGLPYATYVGLEAEAISIRDFEPGVFPGLLQIPDYARAVHEGAWPRLSAEVIDERIEVRRGRQAVLSGPRPPHLRAIIDEAVLHRRVGGAATMRAQLDHVVAACAQPHISVQVIPYEAGVHPALDSTFILLEFEDPVPGVVYVEGLVGQVYLERREDVRRYGEIFDRLLATSLGQQQSLDLMAAMSIAYSKGQ